MSSYDAVDMLAQLVAGIQVLLPWLGAAVGMGIALFLLFLGVRMGYRFFRDFVDDGEHRSLGFDGHDWSTTDAAEWAADEANNRELENLTGFLSPSGWEAADARAWQMYYDWDKSEGGSGTAYADARLARDRSDRE